MLRRQKTSGQGRDGFTVVEAVIASAMLAVISGSFILAYISAMRTHLVASDFYKATCIARNRIQRARTLDFDSLSLLVETTASVDQDGNIDSEGQFRRTTVVTNDLPGRVRISISVQHPIPNGRLSSQPVEVFTMIAKGS